MSSRGIETPVPRPADQEFGDRVTRPTVEGPSVLRVTRGHGDCARTVGVVVIGPDGVRWQPTVDIGRLAGTVTVVAGAVAAVGTVAAAVRRPAQRVDRITMGPGGWVSLRGAARPRPLRNGPRRPWWAVLLRARPASR